MASMRVHELAKEFDMSSKELLDKLHEMKIPAKSHASMLADAYVAKIRKNLEPEIKQRAGQLEDEEAKKLAEERAAAEGAQVIPVCAKLEAEIAELEGEEKAMFLEDLGVHESGLDRLIRASYALLGLISFLTSGEDECRAWTIVKGTKAPQAAGKIHSDFERGFIRAEVIAYDDLMAVGSMAAAREKGMIRSEGKEYVVQDGDIILFRFNV